MSTEAVHRMGDNVWYVEADGSVVIQEISGYVTLTFESLVVMLEKSKQARNDNWNTAQP
jgi:hypothetical protein